MSVRLIPRCIRRSVCRACTSAKSKARLDKPCRMELHTEWVVDGDGDGPNLRQDTTHYSYYRAIEDIFQLFLTFLYKHENDVMAHGTKTFAYFNRVDRGEFNNPVVNVIHLYVTALTDLLVPHKLGCVHST